MTHDFRRDLQWFHKFLQSFNGTSYFDHKPIDHVIELDSCLVGLGGRCHNFIYHLPIVCHYKNLAITQLEMVAIRLFAKMWYRKRVLIKCHNLAVVQVLQRGKTRHPFWGACTCSIWLASAENNIELTYVHIAGKQNVLADLLSRWQNTKSQNVLLKAMVKKFIWLPTSDSLLWIDSHI